MQVSICHRYCREDLQACNLPTFFFCKHIAIITTWRQFFVCLCIWTFSFLLWRGENCITLNKRISTQFSIPSSSCPISLIMYIMSSVKKVTQVWNITWIVVRQILFVVFFRLSVATAQFWKRFNDRQEEFFIFLSWLYYSISCWNSFTCKSYSRSPPQHKMMLMMMMLRWQFHFSLRPTFHLRIFSFFADFF